MTKFFRTFPYSRHFINWSVTILSVIFCVVILPSRLPGMELLGIGPNWPLIWVVVWSIRRKRTLMEAIVGGLALGFLQDSMTALGPSHATSLVLVAILTILLQKIRSIPPEVIETIMAVQFSWMGEGALVQIWTDHQRVALCSAILSSLWAPVIYFPLNRLWDVTQG
jgi:rod shape-determining protein MreD